MFTCLLKELVMINFLVSIGDLNRSNPLKYDFKEVEKLKKEREKVLKFLKKDKENETMQDENKTCNYLIRT